MIQILPTYILTFLIIITINSNLSATNNIHVSSSFEPKTLEVGQRGLLNIIVNDSQNTHRPLLPKIDGLIIEYLGTSPTIQIVDRKPIIMLIHSFTVTPQKIGNFSLPPFNIEIEGKQYPVSSSELTVTEKKQDSSDSAPLVILEVSIDENQAYIGQMIPISITLYARFNLGGQFVYEPTIQGKAFMDYGFKENAQQSITNVNNIPKQTFHYKTFISPLDSGNITLQYKTALAIQKPRPRNSNRGFYHANFSSLFDDLLPIIEEIEVDSPPVNLSVLPLPIHGKPQKFTGAIGQFTLESFSITPQEAQVGDPMTLKMVIKGTGNFDRISPPALNSENWKTYAPKSTFHKTDGFGYTGTDVFEYIIIPQSDQITQSPNITFNFFDPQSGHYTELTPDPVALQISPSIQSSSNNSFFSPIQEKENLQSLSEKPKLLPIKLQISHSVKSLIPLIAQQWFIVTLLTITLFISLLLILFKKMQLKQKEDSLYIKTINLQKSIQSNLEKADKSYSKQNALSFYDAVTTVILESIALQHPQSSQTLTLQDVEEILSEKSFPLDKIAFIKTLFHTSDMLKFSGTNTNHLLTPEIFKKFHDLISELKKITS